MIDNQYLKIQYFCSFRMIEKEKQYLLKSMKMNRNKELGQHWGKRLKQLDKQNKDLAIVICEKQMQVGYYIQKNNKNLIKLMLMFKQFYEAKNRLGMQRFIEYINILKTEIEELKGKLGQQKMQKMVQQVMIQQMGGF